MSQPLLKIRGLKVKVAGAEILKGLDLDVHAGQVVAIMGPNGSGKSSLSRALTGHPDYVVSSGSVEYAGKNLLDLDVQTRALEGLFMGFQYPVEVPGVNNAEFLRMAYNSGRRHAGQPELGAAAFEKFLDEKMKLLEMDPVFKKRGLNVGYSGGEKKRNEILQMAVLEPRLAILDETDSGLDIDALRVVSQGIQRLKHPERAVVLITHYQRLLDHIHPDAVHVLTDGRIVRSGDFSLVQELERQGYDWLKTA